MDCPTSRQLEAFANGTADPGVVMEIESHLKSCTSCAITASSFLPSTQTPPNIPRWPHLPRIT